MVYLIIGAVGIPCFIALSSWYMGRQLRRRAEKARQAPLSKPVPLNTSARNVKTTYVAPSYDTAPESLRRSYTDESGSFAASDVFTTMAAFDSFSSSSYDSSSSDSSFSGGGGDFGGGGGGSDSNY